MRRARDSVQWQVLVSAAEDKQILLQFSTPIRYISEKTFLLKIEQTSHYLGGMVNISDFLSRITLPSVLHGGESFLTDTDWLTARDSSFCDSTQTAFVRHRAVN
jgi:hypothetical protein